jgi:hypothetical protein
LNCGFIRLSSVRDSATFTSSICCEPPIGSRLMIPRTDRFHDVN